MKKKDLNRLFWTKTIFNHALRITYRVRYHIDRNIYKKSHVNHVKGQNDHISLSIEVRPQALRIKNQSKKVFFSLQVKNAVNFKGIRKNNEKFRSRPVWSRV